MSFAAIPDDVRQLIYDCIDSVEQLEILLLLKSQNQQWWTTTEISNHLRSTPSSIESRLTSSNFRGLLEPHPTQPQCYRYKPNEVTDETVGKLSEVYRLRRQAILELIFSPVKKGRLFAEAFVLTKNTSRKDDKDG